VSTSIGPVRTGRRSFPYFRWVSNWQSERSFGATSVQLVSEQGEDLAFSRWSVTQRETKYGLEYDAIPPRSHVPGSRSRSIKSSLSWARPARSVVFLDPCFQAGTSFVFSVLTSLPNERNPAKYFGEMGIDSRLTRQNIVDRLGNVAVVRKVCNGIGDNIAPEHIPDIRLIELQDWLYPVVRRVNIRVVTRERTSRQRERPVRPPDPEMTPSISYSSNASFNATVFRDGFPHYVCLIGTEGVLLALRIFRMWCLL